MRKFLIIAIAIVVLAAISGCGSTSSNSSTATPVAQTTKKIYTAKEIVDTIGETSDISAFCRDYNDLEPEFADALVRGAIAQKYTEEDVKRIENEKNIDAPSPDEVTDELISRC